MAKAPKESPLSDLASAQAKFWAIIAAAVGLLLLLSTSFLHWNEELASLQAFLRELGGLISAGVALAAIWEFGARRAFFREVLALTRIGESLKNAGVIEASTEFYEDLHWRELLENVHELDVLVSYGHTWKDKNSVLLSELAQKKGLRVRLVLPDHQNKVVVDVLAKRYRKPLEYVEQRIKETEADFLKKFEAGKAKLEIWRLSFCPLYTYYRIDNTAIFTSYRHRKERGAVVVLKVMRPGFLFKFFEDEFNACMKDPDLAVRTFPEKKQKVTA